MHNFLQAYWAQLQRPQTSATVRENASTPWPPYFAKRSKRTSPAPPNPWGVALTASTCRAPEVPHHKTSTRSTPKPPPSLESGPCLPGPPHRLQPRRRQQQQFVPHLGPRTSRTSLETMTTLTLTLTRPLVQVGPLIQPQPSLLLSFAACLLFIVSFKILFNSSWKSVQHLTIQPPPPTVLLHICSVRVTDSIT